jgi:hypothetical protein
MSADPPVMEHIDYWRHGKELGKAMLYVEKDQ